MNSPSSVQALWIIIKLQIRFWLNRIGAGKHKSSNEAKNSEDFQASKPRVATGKGRKRGTAITLFFSAIVLFAFTSNFSTIVDKLYYHESSDLFNSSQQLHTLPPLVLNRLQQEEAIIGGEFLTEQCFDFKEQSDENRAHFQQFHDFVYEDLPEKSRYIYRNLKLSEKSKERSRTRCEKLESALYRDFHLTFSSNQSKRLAKDSIRHFQEHGLKCFYATDNETCIHNSTTLLPDPTGWDEPHKLSYLFNIFSLLSLALLFFMFSSSLGFGNRNLGVTSLRTEWLFTLPVKRRIIIIATLLEYTFLNPFNLILGYSLTLPLFCASGGGNLSFVLAIFPAIYLSFLTACGRLTCEFFLRLKTSPRTRQNLQALASLLSLGGVFCIFILARMDEIPDWLNNFGKSGSNSALFFPTSWPLYLCAHDFLSYLMPACALLFLIAAIIVSLKTCCHLCRFGLCDNPGMLSTNKKKSTRKSLFKGIIGKELLLLRRDRVFFIQAFVTPIAVIGIQLAVNNDGITNLFKDNFKTAATMAFAFGAYFLTFSAFQILNVEQKATWLLYTFPSKLHTPLLKKTQMWAISALFFPTIILAIALKQQETITGDNILAGAMSLGGVLLYTFIAGGMGIISTDPTENEAHRRQKPTSLYLYLTLATFYTPAIYSVSIWYKISALLLTTTLAFAIWQLVRDKLPNMLEPQLSIAKKLTLAEAIFWTIIFMVIQLLVTLLLTSLNLPSTHLAFFSYLISGISTFLLSYLHIRIINKLPLKDIAGKKWNALNSKTLLAIVLATASSVTVATIYILVLKRFWPQLITESLNSSTKTSVWIAVGLAVFAAPLFEEYLFRGLLFNSLRRSFPIKTSIFATALLFALIHPPLSFIPVFFLGATTSWVYHKTQSLIASILTHACYNASILLIL